MIILLKEFVLSGLAVVLQGGRLKTSVMKNQYVMV